MTGNELSHLIKLSASGQSKEFRPFLYGHISMYDPKLGRVKCIVPSLAGQDGRPVLTAWMPLGSIAAGNGWGIQVAPVGGASFDNPTDGEQVAIGVFDREAGTVTAQLWTWNGAASPPDTGLLPGEMVIKHLSGSLLKFHKNGSVELSPKTDLDVVAGANLNITVTGTASLDLQGELHAVISGSATIDAPTIVLAGGGPAVARVGDSVTVGSQIGTIVSGSEKVTCG